MYGTRARIGYTSPPAVTETFPYEFYKIVPEGVTLAITTLNIVKMTDDEVKDGAKLDCSKITAVAGDRLGSNMNVRFASPEVRNFSINSLYPNPFNPITSIDYSVEKAGDLHLSIYNILGQEVTVLYNGYQTEGESFKIKWDANSFSSGVYFVHMLMNGQVETMKAIVIK